MFEISKNGRKKTTKNLKKKIEKKTEEKKKEKSRGVGHSHTLKSKGSQL